MNEVYCVSLGPGDPELLTLKALRVLKSSDLIYCPGTQRGGKIVSRAGDLLTYHGIEDDKIRYFSVPMNPDRSHATRVYEEISEEIIAKHTELGLISFVSEGDSGLYCSMRYVSDYLEAKGIAVQTIAGIPAFISAGAIAGFHIVKQDEPLLVLPSTSHPNEIITEIEKGKSVVLMKLSRHEEVIKTVLRQVQEAEVHYFENVGVEGREYHTQELNEILQREFPYFSLMIIKKN